MLYSYLYYDSGRPHISVISLFRTVDHPKKPVCTFLTASSVGEADRRRKIGGLTVPAGSHIVFSREKTGYN
jgi:hypothetical protein